MTINKEKLKLQKAIIEKIETVFDPEIPVNIWDLGLIYDIQISDIYNVSILMTLTSPACPVAGLMPEMVYEAARSIPLLGSINVELVWEPPWEKSMMSERARIELDMF